MNLNGKFSTLVCSLLIFAFASPFPAGAGETKSGSPESERIAAISADLANKTARKKFDVAPFSAKDGIAIFHKGAWKWHAVKGFGKGDLQAVVMLSKNGTARKVEVAELSSENTVMNPL